MKVTINLITNQKWVTGRLWQAREELPTKIISVVTTHQVSIKGLALGKVNAATIKLFEGHGKFEDDEILSLRIEQLKKGE